MDARENDRVIKLVQKEELDFDDSYQWMVSRKYEIQLVSFDNDFKKKGFNTLEPKEAMMLYLNKAKLK